MAPAAVVARSAPRRLIAGAGAVVVAVSVFAATNLATAQLKPNEIQQSLEEAGGATQDLGDLLGAATTEAEPTTATTAAPTTADTVAPGATTLPATTTTAAPTTTAPPTTLPPPPPWSPSATR